MSNPSTTPTRKQLTLIRYHSFAKLVFTGKTQAAAYKALFNPNASDRRATEQASRIAARPEVRAELSRLEKQSDAPVLLTINERLGILSAIAKDKKSKPHEKSRAIEVYSKIAGDQAPERHEVALAAPDGGPVKIEATAQVVVGRLSIADKIKAMREARAERKAAEERSRE